MSQVLDTIRDYADKAHGDQMRKYAPDRYIVHPVRVMEICKKYSTLLPVHAAALLHDVLEDTEVKPEEMHEFLRSVMSAPDAAHTLQLVIELTDVYTKKAHPLLNRRKRKAREMDRLANVSGEAQTIKYADIIDNSKEIGSYDSDFAPVFLNECKTLLRKMTKGDRELYHEAQRVVESELKQLHSARK